MENKPTITVAITGASGAAYALRLLELLVQHKQRVFILVSDAARIVLETEEGITLPQGPSTGNRLSAGAFFRGNGTVESLRS